MKLEVDLSDTKDMVAAQQLLARLLGKTPYAPDFKQDPNMIIPTYYRNLALERDICSMDIRVLELTTRSHDRLNDSYNTVGDLCEATKSDLFGITGFGNKSMREVEEVLCWLGLSLNAGIPAGS
jgi:DNA-directed RNA polymerase alpha subunit